MPQAEHYNLHPLESPEPAAAGIPQQEAAGFYHRYGRRLAAGALALAAVTGVSGCSAVSTFNERAGSYISQDDTDKESGSQQESIAPVTAEVPEDIRLSFSAAVTAETMAEEFCETPVTAEEVTSMYQRLFLTSERPGLSLAGLQSRTEEISSNLTATREKLGMHQLPEAFYALQEDADGLRTVPLSEYEKLAADYFAKFGLETMFAWEDQGYMDPNYDPDMNAIAHRAVPVTERVIGENNMARTRILAAMRGFSLIPPELVTDKPLKRIVFGDILDSAGHGGSDGAAGLYASMENAVYVDIAHEELDPDERPLTAYHRANVSIATHELAHKNDIEICGLALAISGNDAAMDALNDGFKYAPENVRETEEIEAGMPIDGKYGTITEGPEAVQEVVALRDYGTMSAIESKAVDVGELAMHGNSMRGLFEHEGDTGRIEKRIAYQMARMNKDNPEAVAYFAQLFDAARLQMVVDEASIKASESLDQYIHDNFGSGSDFDSDSKFLELQAAAEPYYRMNEKLTTAMSGEHKPTQ